MRFNCQSCGAKYQIADEKASGKTVRMKCRKCSAVIQVRSKRGAGKLEPQYLTGPSGHAPGSRPSTGGPTSGPRPPPRRAPGRAPARPGLRAGVPPRPGGPPRPGAPSRPRPSAPAARPVPSHPTGSPPPAQTDDEATVVMDRPSLADIEQAISARASAAGAPAPARGAGGGVASGAAPAAAGPWYVGIGGKPVGPVDHGYLAAQIEASRVTATSLVWREGMADWKPFNSFEELRRLLADRRPAAAAPAAAVSDPVALTRVKDQAGEAAAGPAAAPGTAPAEQLSGLSGGASEQVLMAPSAAEAAAAVAAGLDTPAPLSGGAVPPAARAPSTETPPSAKSETPPDASTETPPDSIDLAELGIRKKRDRRRRKRGMHPMAWAFVAMAASFGGVAAYVLLVSSSGGDTRSAGGGSLVSGTAASGKPGSGAGAPSATASPTAIELAQVDVTADQGKGPRSTGSSGSPAPSASASSGHKRHGSTDCTPDDPFCGQSGVTGPSTGSSGANGSESGRGLTPGQAQSVVNRNRHAVSRKCMGYVSSKGGSTKVYVTIKIAPSGSVRSAAVSGGKDYPGLTSCVRNRVRNWHFPRAGESTTVNVSFNFISQ